jgi:hypothetical protein
MVMGVNKANATQTQTNRDKLYSENGGKIVNGVKYPYNKGTEDFNKIFLPKKLKIKLKEYNEKKNNDVVDELFNELIK